MSMEYQMKNGLLYVESGHASEEDKAYEKKTELERERIKDLCYEYNNTRPSDYERKTALLGQMLGGMGKNIWIEAPCHFSYGCNTYLGDGVYANFNLTVVDDGEVHIGNKVMFAPNVVISTTGHPVHPYYRERYAQFSLPVHIGDMVWIGANVTILPGVTIGENSVIGAGSVVTHDIPANVVAVGSPCRVIREITEEDMKFYKKGYPVNEDWNK